MLPLSLGIIPWALMAGSLAITAGLTVIEAISLSVFVFAGATQIMSLSMLMMGASIWSIFIIVFFMTTQHYIYALKLRPHTVYLKSWQRLSIAFLLTDELNAVSELYPHRKYAYLLDAGLSFYMFWVVFSVIGVAGSLFIEDITSLHLDFSIVIIFLVMGVLILKNRIGIIAVLVSITMMFILTYLHVSMALIIASLTGMAVAALFEREVQE